MIAVLCPGQGAQHPGMLLPWLAEPGAAEFVAELSAAADLDLAELGTTADATTLRDTAITQPLIVTAGLLAWRALAATSPAVELVAGHSIGEVTAAAVAGCLSPVAAVTLAAARGRAMAAAADAAEASGMSAVVGGDPTEVAAAITAAGAHVANFNGPGQIVAAGSQAALAALAEHPPARARVVPLDVHGAFHSPFMAPAVSAVTEAATALSFELPQVRYLSNGGGTTLLTGDAIRTGIIHQLTNPVDWTACCAEIAAAAPTQLVELAPAGVLTRIAKRAVPGIPALALTNPAAVTEVAS